MKKKILGGFAVVMSLVMVIGVGSSIAMSYAVYHKMSDGIEVKAEEIAEKEKEDEEEKQDPQYVTIDKQYEIRDTSAISDAYISGDTSKLTEDEKKTYDIAKKTFESIVKDNMSVYQKEEAIYDWLGDNINFNSSSLMAVPGSNVNCFTPYGVLTGKNAVCVGFATTFKLFMNMMGLECMVEHDESLSHSWDLVKLDDDQWYLVDVTLDDRYNGKVLHKYFNCTNAQFADNHTFDASLYPVAQGMKYNYAAQNAKDIKDVKKIPSVVKSAIEKKKYGTYLRLPKDVDLEYIQAMAQGISDRLSMAENYYEESAMSMDGDGRYILCIYLNFYSDDNGSTTDLSQFSGLEELLNNTFGEAVSGATGEDGMGLDEDHSKAK